jgi:hypothetical protein
MPTFRRWQPHEDEILARMYVDPSFSRKEIEQALSRTWYSIVERAQKLQLSRLAPGEWSPAELALLGDLFTDPSLSQEEMEQRFGRSWDAIYQKGRKIGLSQSKRRTSQFCKPRIDDPRRWTPEQIVLLRELFANVALSRGDLESRVGRTWSAIQTKASELNLRRILPRKYQICTDYFRNVTSDKQAYLLGLLAADGSVSKRGTIEIELQRRDEALVNFVRSEIAPGVPLRERYGVRLYFSSIEMVTDLAVFGIIPRKSYSFIWPKALPEALAIPFILGYFDGDGHFKQGCPGKWQWELLGTYDFLFAVKARLEYYADINLSEPKSAKPKVSPHLYRLQASGKRVIAIDRLLNASGLGLPRKHLPPDYCF